jgi:hypothetical protein
MIDLYTGGRLRSTLSFLFAPSALCHTGIPLQKHFAKNHARNVNGFWAVVCQYVPFRAESSAENPIDCRIFFADNPR